MDNPGEGAKSHSKETEKSSAEYAAEVTGGQMLSLESPEPKTTCSMAEADVSAEVSKELESIKTRVAEMEADAQLECVESVTFKVIYNKNREDVKFPLHETIAKLKEHLSNLPMYNGIPATSMKLMCKGLAKDNQTLQEVGVVEGAKVLLVGSTPKEIMGVKNPAPTNIVEEPSSTSSSKKEPLCKQKVHQRVLEKGIPDDVMVGIRNCKESLPTIPLSGMLNRAGGKVRLTFKLEIDQLWIGTRERTDKIAMNSIRNIVSEAIEGNEQYHIMGIQLGPTEASRYWVYWVPAQYIDAIKDTVLGYQVW